MREQNETSIELGAVAREIEEALGRLTPVRPEALERDWLLYEAGRRDAQQSLRRRINGWRVAAGAIAAGLLVSLVLNSRVEDRLTSAPVAMPATQENRGDSMELASIPSAAMDAGFFPINEPNGSSYRSLQRRWMHSGEIDWSFPPRPMPAVNPRSRVDAVGPQWRGDL